MEPIKIFISYAHLDENLKDRIIRQLATLVRKGSVSIWDDHAIDAGADFKSIIAEELEKAALILLLVSDRFIASDFCHEIEMKRALQRYDAGEARVIPIIGRACDWTPLEFARANPLPRDGKAIQSHTNKDEALAKIAIEIRKIVEEIHSKDPGNLATQSTPANGLKPEDTKRLTSEEKLKGNLECLQGPERLRYYELAVFPRELEIPITKVRRLWGRTGCLADSEADDLCERFRSLSLLPKLGSKRTSVRLPERYRRYLIAHPEGQDLSSIHNVLLRAHKPTPSVPWSEIVMSDSYLRKYLTFHLKEAGNLTELIETVSSWRYLFEKIHVRDWLSIEKDLSMADDVAPNDSRLRTVQLILDNFYELFDSWTSANQPQILDLRRTKTLEGLNARLQDDARISGNHYLTLSFQLPKTMPVRVRSCRFSDDGESIISASDDPEAPLKVWSASSGEFKTSVGKPVTWDHASVEGSEGHTQEVRSCAFGHETDLVVSGSADQVVILWDLEHRGVRRKLTDHTGAVNDCCFSPSGKKVVSGSDDGTIRVWDMNTYDSYPLVDTQSGAVNCCVFVHEELIISGSTDCKIRVWNTATSNPRHILPGHEGPVRSCASDKSAQRIVSASDDGTLIVWDAESWQPLKTLKAHSNRVNGCCFGNKGRVIVSVSSDCTVKVWNVETGTCLATFRTDGEMFSCAMDGDRVVAGGAGGLYFLRLIDPLSPAGEEGYWES